MNNRKQEVCRDFQRGSCRFGARCKFIHQAPQSNQRNSRFGSGAQTQGAGNFFAVLSENNTAAGQQQAHPPANDHKCSDTRLCKERIKEDFANEYPSFWRLTSYAHWKYLPNDICGDVSFEELRSVAYESAKHGSSITDVVQKEQAMFTAKSSEFEALLRNQYTGPATQSSSMLPQVAFDATSFSNSPQFAARTLFGKAVSNGSITAPQPSSQTSNLFGSPTMGGHLQSSGGFAGGFGKGPNAAFGGVLPFPQQSNSASYSPSSSPVQSSQSPLETHNMFGAGTNVVPTFGGFGSSITDNMTLTSLDSKMQPSFGSHAVGSTFALPPQPFKEEMMSTNNTQSVEAKNTIINETFPSEVVKGQAPAISDIWLADKWSLGQIPEEEPPIYARR
ncbi:hypothetical protein O6H91_13G080300 [Diphasiastrum complanatum]|uniref:Uncharacterized protein n=1 Tax=Diphasiastrum complanatum TaxID=34168 RepID=A0ACC2BWJ0_DIPCM|nr:hypothetical protein O6H91_13G080300 [Diphasiastrum complanatum]